MLAAVILAVLPLFVIWILPMLYLYNRVQRSYRKTAREVKRSESLRQFVLVDLKEETERCRGRAVEEE